MLDWKLAAFADEASGELAGQIAAMKRNGIGGLEIRFVDGQNIAKVSCDKAKEIRDRLADEGLHVWSIGSPTGKIKLQDDFAPHLEEFKHQLELAHIMGAEHFRLFSFYGADDSDGAFNDVCERTAAFLKAAEGSGVVICHENEKDIFGDTDDRCVKLLSTFPALRAIFDPANFLQCGVNVLPAWEKLAPYVEYLHIKDCNKNGEVVPPGLGEGQLPALLAAYGAQGGRVLTLEPHLNAFIGLDQLENSGSASRSAYSYASADEAFDAAVTALKSILP